MDINNKSKILSATLADVYLEQGHIEKALQLYERLAKREPENDFYKKRTAALKKELKERNNLPGFKRILKKKLW